MEAAKRQVAGGGVMSTSPTAPCPCGVLTTQRLCAFCRRTVALIKAGRCVSCTARIVGLEDQKDQGKCGDCMSRNERLCASTRRLLHQAANARYVARLAA